MARKKDLSPNARKSWTEEDVKEVLKFYVEKGKTPREIHTLFGRSLSSIKVLISGFNAVRGGRPNTFLSEGVIRVMREYLAERKEGTTPTFIKHEQSQVSAPSVAKSTVPVQTEQRIDAVGQAFEALKVAVADLVEHEIDRGVTEKVQAVQAELQDLREFKEKAKEANPSGFIRARLFGSK